MSIIPLPTCITDIIDEYTRDDTHLPSTTKQVLEDFARGAVVEVGKCRENCGQKFTQIFMRQSDNTTRCLAIKFIRQKVWGGG